MMNEVSTILIDVLTESAFQVIDRCAWLYHIYCANVGKIKDICSSFQQTLLTEYETNINQIRVLFEGYTVESTKGWEQKSRKKNLYLLKWKLIGIFQFHRTWKTPWPAAVKISNWLICLMMQTCSNRWYRHADSERDPG